MVTTVTVLDHVKKTQLNTNKYNYYIANYDNIIYCPRSRQAGALWRVDTLKINTNKYDK